MNKGLILIVLCGVLAACQQQEVRKLPYYDTADFTPKWELPAEGTFHEIRAFSLVDQHGTTFTEKDMAGKICVVDFFFTSCPGICPKLTKSMGTLQEAFLDSPDILLVSHSVTPDKDQVPVLNTYAQKKGVQYAKWRLLTGNKEEIYNLGRKYYFIEEDLGENRDADIFLHTENFVLIDKHRRIRGIYNGLDPDSIRALEADIVALRQEE